MLNFQILNRAATIMAILSISACASSPQYVPADDADDYGHYTTQLSENRYRVVFNGNSRTNLNTTKDFALLRAAELTLQEGYTWFEVVDRSTMTTERGGHEPHSGVSYERSYNVERTCGLLGCTKRVRPSTTTGVHVDAGRQQTTHSFSMEILMGNGEMPERGGNFYDASDTAKTLWKKI